MIFGLIIYYITCHDPYTCRYNLHVKRANKSTCREHPQCLILPRIFFFFFRLNTRSVDYMIAWPLRDVGDKNSYWQLFAAISLWQTQVPRQFAVDWASLQPSILVTQFHRWHYNWPVPSIVRVFAITSGLLDYFSLVLCYWDVSLLFASSSMSFN